MNSAIMPGGNKSGLKPGQSGHTKQMNTVQTLLSAKLDSSKEKAPKKGRTHSELSNESNNSLEFDLSGLENIQRDLSDIKLNLQSVTKIEDLNEATKDLVKTKELETVVTNIVNKLWANFQQVLEEKIEAKITVVKSELMERIDALSIENESLKQQVEFAKQQICKTRTEVNSNSRMTMDAITKSNYNEQYSRKNNIKVLNLKWKEKQNLREDFIELVKKDLKVELEPRDVVAIHRLPSTRAGEKPCIVRLFNSDVKRMIMREKKHLKNNVLVIDDITQQNYELMKRLRNSQRFESVWFFNCHIYGRTENGLQLKFDLFDDIDLKIRQAK